MDELDEFLESLGEDVAPSPSRIEEADLEAEFEELFKQSESSNPQVDDLGEEEDDDDDDDEEFTLTGGGNLGPLHANPQASPQFQKTPVKALVEKLNNTSEKSEKEKQRLSPEEKPKAKQVDLVPALQERNSDFKVRNPEEMKAIIVSIDPSDASAAATFDSISLGSLVVGRTLLFPPNPSLKPWQRKSSATLPTSWLTQIAFFPPSLASNSPAALPASYSS